MEEQKIKSVRSVLCQSCPEVIAFFSLLGSSEMQLWMPNSPHFSVLTLLERAKGYINTRPRTTVNPTWSEHGQKAKRKPSNHQLTKQPFLQPFNLQCVNLEKQSGWPGRPPMGTSLSQTGSKQLWNPRPGAQRADLEVLSMQLEHAIESHYDFGVSKPIGPKMD